MNSTVSYKHKVLAISSLPANGNAGLKMVMSILGTRVIPVPSLVLSGIGSLPGFQKFPLPFEDLLKSSLQLARQRGERLLVYVGYLMEAEQIGVIARLIDDYRDLIEFVLVDPICGDNGRAYVPAPIIAAWPALLAKADYALPNLTETFLLTQSGEAFDPNRADEYVMAFQQKFPHLPFVVTSLEQGNELVNRRFGPGHAYEVGVPVLPARYGGSGDALGAYFLHFWYFEGDDEHTAMEKATQKVYQAIAFSHSNGLPDLHI